MSRFSRNIGAGNGADADIATFVPEQMQILWPDDHDLRRILIRSPGG